MILSTCNNIQIHNMRLLMISHKNATIELKFRRSIKLVFLISPDQLILNPLTKDYLDHFPKN
jgi:hypothetical protein